MSTPPPSSRVWKLPIQFERQLPRKYLGEREKVYPRAEHVLFAELPKDYYPVRVRLSTRSIHEAAETALDALDLMRGIWNWFYNRQHPTRISFGSASPVNQIVLGPVHTLHKPSGVLASEIFWYEPSYHAPVITYQLKNISQLRKFNDLILRGLARSNYRSEVEQAIIRYTRALDERDWNVAFLKLWGVLEYLTHSSKLSHEVTMQRTAFVFTERSYQMQVLRHLRDYRNRSVHASANTTEIEAYMYQVKSCVEALLEFHIGNRFNFTSLEEACNFLDLPASENELRAKSEELKMRMKTVRHARKYRGYGPG